MVIHATQPESTTILDAISSDGYVLPKNLTNGTNRMQMEEAIRKLVDANVLRCNKGGRITWHGGVLKDVFGKKAN